jgi:tetratricopeptide (TPR) repeat protein
MATNNPAHPAPAPQPAGGHWLTLGRACIQAGRFRDAIRALQQASAALPLDLDVYRALVEALQGDGQIADAMSARIGIDAIGRRCALDVYQIGRVYSRHGQWPAACHWYERALLIDPLLWAAHIGMAWALRKLDRAAGPGHHAGRAYRRLPAFGHAKAGRGRRTVLVLCSTESGNVPFRHLLPRARNRLIRWILDYGLAGPAHAVPPHDVIFNAIGDADLARRSADSIARFMATMRRPVINAASRVARSSRDRIARLLDGVAGIHVPATTRWDRQGGDAAGIHAAIAHGGQGYPVIVRPVGQHGGEGVVLLRSGDDASELPSMGEMYLTRYCEYRSADGYFRKYRAIFVDRQAYPYHLAIGSQWLLHYGTADMLSAPWKTEEERRFLDDPASVIGAAAWAALGAIARRMDLDYCGIDFALLPDGRLLVFEVNATMLARPEMEDDALRFKNLYVQRIYDAVDRMLARRASAAGQS